MYEERAGWIRKVSLDQDRTLEVLNSEVGR